LLERRFAVLLCSWPDAIVGDIVAYLSKSPDDVADDARGAERFWTELPRWLTADRRFAGSKHIDRRWLSDILWAQYCVFLFVRIHDDLFDGQARTPSLLFVADALLLESQRTLAKHFPHGPFWPLFRKCLEATIHGIMEVDARQQRPGAMNERSLALYADVSAIFKIGSAAVCVRSGRMREFRRLSVFADEIAIAGQILDDVLDVQEDLARARYNFAANQLLAGDGVTPHDRAARLAQSVLFDDGAGRLLDVAGKHLDRAAAAIAPLRLAPASEYVGTFRRSLDEFRRRIHYARVEHVFRSVMKPASLDPPGRPSTSDTTGSQSACSRAVSSLRCGYPGG
jgi:hypothetical protein